MVCIAPFGRLIYGLLLGIFSRLLIGVIDDKLSCVSAFGYSFSGGIDRIGKHDKIVNLSRIKSAGALSSSRNNDSWRNKFTILSNRLKLGPIRTNINDSSSNAFLFISRRSGGNLGKKAYNTMQKYSGSVQVTDLVSKLSFKVLSSARKNGSIPIFCCGGDGTANWIMDAVNDYNISNAEFCIVPLGTGNDLFQHELNLLANNASQRKYLEGEMSIDSLTSDPGVFVDKFIKSNKSIELDRWALSITPRKRFIKRMFYKLFKSSSDILREPPCDENITESAHIFSRTAFLKKLVGLNGFSSSCVENSYDSIRSHKCFTNYFGIGVDGVISMEFAELRKKAPSLFFHRFANKVWYFMVGLKAYLMGKRKYLADTVDIFCDGVHCKLPDHCQGIIFSNIDSYAGGTKLWKFGDQSSWLPQNSSDCKLEVYI